MAFRSELPSCVRVIATDEVNNATKEMNENGEDEDEDENNDVDS